MILPEVGGLSIPHNRWRKKTVFSTAISVNLTDKIPSGYFQADIISLRLLTCSSAGLSTSAGKSIQRFSIVINVVICAIPRIPRKPIVSTGPTRGTEKDRRCTRERKSHPCILLPTQKQVQRYCTGPGKIMSDFF